MFEKKLKIVIYVTAKQLVVAFPGKQPEILMLPPEVVMNHEVINMSGLSEIVRSWAGRNPGIEKNGAEIVWLFAPDMYFEHIQTEEEKKLDWNEIVEQFVDLLPYEEVLWRKYNINGVNKVVAINKGFYKALRNAFAEVNCDSVAEVAAGEVGKGVGQGMTMDLAKQVVKNLESISKLRILVPAESEVLGIGLNEQGNVKKSSLPLLIGVFVALLGILGYLVINMNK